MKNKLLKIIICILTLTLLLSGCTGEGDVTDTQQGIVDLGSDAVTEEITDAISDTQAPEKTYVNMWKYSQERGITVRDIVIETGKGGEDIEIIQLTDMHIAYANETDLQDSQISKTYNSRTWGRNGQFLSNAVKYLEFGKNADQIVITGDIYDYLTSEVAAQVNKYIFSAYANVMACLGNHESVKEMGEEGSWSKSTIEARLETLKQSWVNDIYY